MSVASSRLKPALQVPEQGATEDVQTEELCPRCSAIDFEAVISDGEQLESSNGGLGMGTLIVNLGPVTQWNTNSCGLCKMLLASIPLKSFKNPPDNYSLRFHYSQDRRLQIYYPLLKALSPMITVLKMDGPDTQAHYVSSPFLALHRTDGNAEVRILSISSIDFMNIRSWLDLCWEMHKEECGTSSALSISSLKLIDCDTRMVIRAGQAKHPKYVTLSYICGTINDPPHAHDKLPSPLPETIEDAIQVTTRLGLKYLWVDRYCIDQKNILQKMSQIQQMNLIYSNSEVTLIAAAGNNAYYGLPGVSRRPRFQHHYSNFGRHQLVSTLQPIGPVRGALDHSHWSTRAWCYQEALLSKRRLIFTDEQVYYECRGMSCCEVLNLPYREMHKENGQSFREEYLHFSTREIGKFTAGVGNSPHHLFKRIEEYTRKDLSFQSDRLNAFHGILNRFGTELHSSRHVWGQPIVLEPGTSVDTSSSQGALERAKNWYGHGSFVDGLSWRMQGCGGRESDRPSWSWTGWAFPILYRFIYCSVDDPEESHLARVAFELDSGRVLSWDEFQDSYTRITDAAHSCRILHISAMTLPLRLVEDEESELFLEADLDDGYYLSWPVTTPVDKDISTSPNWLLRSDLGPDTQCHALVITQMTSMGEPFFIFLLIIAEVDGIMERVGGGWLGAETTLCNSEGDELQVENDGEWVSGLRAKYGSNWWKSLVGERRMHRIG
jgi:hypothetical protein